MTVLHYIHEQRAGISADHTNMVKYADHQDKNFQRVMKEMRRMGILQRNDGNVAQGR